MATISTDLVQQSPRGAQQAPVVIAVNADGTAIGGGGGGGTSEVEVTNFPATQLVSGTVTATGPLTNAQLTAVTGTAAQTSIATDPSVAGLTTNSLLRGILAELQAQTTILEEIATNTAT